MTHFLHSQDDLDAGLAQLIAQDPRLVPVAEKAGAFNLRRREGDYAGLCAIVCGQQLSVASAAAIRDRLFAAFDPFHHDAVRLARTNRLKRHGLSAAKIKSIKEIGKAVASGRIDLDAVGDMDADVAHAALTALHGIGPWTADIYLLFCLGHADAFPSGDLAVQESARIAPRSGAAKQLVVFLHGYGADGNDLIDIGRAWQGLLPDAAFVSPHAPNPCGQAPVGREWFPLTFRDPNERWIGVNQAAPMLGRFLDAELQRHKLPPEALALVGFSQGTMMALHVGLRRAVAPAAIVGFSGLLVAPPDGNVEALAAEITSRPPVLLV